MKPRMTGYFLAFAIASVPMAAAIGQSDMDRPRWMANLARHQKVIMYGVPDPYDAIRDPTPDTPAKLRRGATVFDQHCASCHGWSGEGSGPEGFFLVPAPADLAWLNGAPRVESGSYLYWTIAEGGKAFESEMPAFKRTLSKEEIWAVTAYIRAGMPHASP